MNIKIAVWVFFIALAVILIGPNPDPRGFRAASGALAGNVIYKINGVDADEAAFLRNYSGVVELETNKGKKFINSNGTLGIDAERVAATNLDFGLDIRGGVRAIIKPNITGQKSSEVIDQTISTLRTRINVFGLRESVFRPLYYEDDAFIEITIAGGNEQELKSLLESEGRFEAKIPILLRTRDSKAVLKLDKDYVINVNDEKIEINGNAYNAGDSFELAGVKLLVNAVKNSSVNLTSTVFSGNDIKAVFFDPQRSRIERRGDGYEWSFSIQISSEGAKRFAWVTNNLGVVPGGYLDEKIHFYLDDGLIDALNIASSLKGRQETEVLITGGAQTLESAVSERSYLQSILRSGQLPTSIEVVQLDAISPNLGYGFLRNAAMAGIVAMIGVSIIISLRYRKPRIIVPMLVVSFSEVIIILGIASAIGWTIDLAAIAGIIAVVGTGIDAQVVIIDNALRKGEELTTIKERLGRAFFVIFGAAGTVVAAMLPLMTIGFGLLRGFAITTIIGVFVGVFIARPAFGEIVKKIMKE